MAERGEIYWIDWSPGRGSEQTSLRPSLIVQNDTGNAASPNTIVVTISTQSRRPYPFHVLITPEESGLRENSIVKCEQVLTVHQSRLQARIGVLGADRMLEVDTALKRSLGL